MGPLLLLILVSASIKAWNLSMTLRLVALPSRWEMRQLERLAREVEAGVNEPSIRIHAGGVFGYRDWKMSEFVNSRQRPEVKLFCRVLSEALFSYPGLVLGTSLLAVTVLMWPKVVDFGRFPFSRTSYPQALFGLLMFLILQGLLSAVLVRSSYATYRIPKRQTGSGSRRAHELNAFLRALAMLWIVSVVATLAGSSWFDDFWGMPRTKVSWTSVVDSVYFVCSTFSTVGFGDIHANGTASRGFVALVEASVFVLVAVLLATTGSEPVVPESRDELEREG